MSEPTVRPAPNSLAEYLAMARGRLGNMSPAERRVKAAVAARDTLRHNLTLDLKHMSQDELVLTVMEMRGALALLLSITLPAATPPSAELGDDDLVAHIFDLISDAAPLHAEVDVHLGRRLPSPLLQALLKGINADQARATGNYVEALGHCGTSTVHLTTLAAAGDTG
ncbi:hypothetical protein ACIRQF_30825 [Streptomyces sp. NPDC101191]|uniref:hypothetical protein n=1 Tax=Streptomyces sp. NPDC101191 TaxID=3366126 RepID=UPI00380CF9C2